MGNQKNARKKVPTAKKLAENELADSPPPRRTLPRPKPRPTGKAATKKPSRAEASHTGTAEEAPESIAPTSKKAVKDRRRRSVTWADNDVSMVDCGAAEDEVIEEDNEVIEEDDEVIEEDNESQTWDDLVNEFEEEVENIKRHMPVTTARVEGM